MKTTIRESQIKDAAKHFINLYSEEIKAGEINKDTINEWWISTADQYNTLEREDIDLIEREIYLNI